MDVVDRREGLRWLAQLRWWALGGALAGVICAMMLGWSFVDTPALSGGVAAMGLANMTLIWRLRREREVGKNELILHAIVDLLFLTWLLAWAGGVRNPISFAFSFHVVLGALLNGRRGALAAAVTSLLSIALLVALEATHHLPVPPLEQPPRSLWVLSLGLLVAGLSYLALVVAERQAAQNKKLVDEQREATSSVALLLESLEALKVGLELVGADGNAQLENETARALKSAPQAIEAARSVEGIEGDRAVSRRFAVAANGANGNARGEGNERIIDLIALPPSKARPARALLYVDRTDELLVEQRHVMLERLATLGRAMQGVAHELNTPLTTMQTLAKDLRVALADAELDEKLRVDVEESLTLLIEESRRCRNLTQALLSRAADGRAGAASASDGTLLEVARRAVRLVAPSDEGDDVFLDEKSLDVHCAVDADRVLQIVMNLVQNALRATVELRGDGKGPRVVVRADKGRITIKDRGPGLPEEVRARLFEPFVTTRPVGEGTGLGLYTSQRIAHELGGSLELDSTDGGTIATLTLPATSMSARTTSAPKATFIDARSSASRG